MQLLLSDLCITRIAISSLLLQAAVLLLKGFNLFGGPLGGNRLLDPLFLVPQPFNGSRSLSFGCKPLSDLPFVFVKDTVCVPLD